MTANALPLLHQAPHVVRQPSSQSRRAVFGHSLPQSRFAVQEFEGGRIDAASLMGLLHGSSLCIVVRGFVSAKDSARCSLAFDRTVCRQRVDGVPAWQLGASHYGVSTEAYFDAVEATDKELRTAYALARVDLAAHLTVQLQLALDPGLALRPAVWNGRRAAALRAAAWAKRGDVFSLAPHDDAQQLRLPEQADFEIQAVMGPVAANLYTRVPAVGGQLRIWNLRPVPLCKRDLGIERTGYPYDPALLDGIAFIDVQPRAGDLVLLNGSFLHAVVGWGGKPGQRIVWNGFLGLTRDASSVLHWT
jgi:hypothetical protein